MAVGGLGQAVCSLTGLLCFGIALRRLLWRAGLRVLVFDGPDNDTEPIFEATDDFLRTVLPLSCDSIEKK